MGRKPKSRPSFFKVMIKDFTSHMQLPPVFVLKYGENLAENTKLRISSGETWNVELEKVDEDSYYFTRGWNEFAKNVGVKLGEFLVFWFDISNSTFDVSLFGTNGCERQISTCNSPVEDSEPEVKNAKSRAYNVKDEAAGSDGGTQEHVRTSVETRLRFKLHLKNHHLSRVCLRKDFVQAADLIGKKAVVLKYQSKQRYWPVLLVYNSKCMHEMAAGWHEFRRKNGLAFGKFYTFEFDPTTNVIQVEESTTCS